jgi:hypothetical protein
MNFRLFLIISASLSMPEGSSSSEEETLVDASSSI